jgi:hypothetical protein
MSSMTERMKRRWAETRHTLKLKPLFYLNRVCTMFCGIAVFAFLLHRPPAGFAIGFLGFVGVVVAIVGDENLSRPSRATWAVITAFLLVIEVIAIQKDRKEQYDLFTGGDDFGYMVYMGFIILCSCTRETTSFSAFTPDL